jgi:hypothetical protein
VRKPHRRSAAHQQQRPRAKLQEKERAPQHLQAVAAAKKALHLAEGREAQLTPDRAPTLSVNHRDLMNAKPTVAHTSRDPTLNALAQTNPAQAKRRLEHVTTRNQVNGNQVVRPSNPNDNSKVGIFDSAWQQ